MKPRILAEAIFLIFADVCLVANGVILRQWLIVGFVLGLTGAWLVIRRHPAIWARASLLAGYVSLSACVTILGGSLPLAFLGLSCSLAAWELRDFSVGTGESPPDNPRDLEWSHLRAVALMLLCTLVLGACARLLAPKLSFWSAVLLAAIAVGALAYLVRSTRRLNDGVPARRRTWRERLGGHALIGPLPENAPIDDATGSAQGLRLS